MNNQLSRTASEAPGKQFEGLVNDQQKNLNGLQSLVERLTRFRDSVSGSMPQNAGSGAVAAVPNGIYDRMVDIKNHTGVTLSTAHTIMDELERFA